MKVLLPLLLIFASCASIQPSVNSTNGYATELYEKMLNNGHWEFALFSKQNCLEKIRDDKHMANGSNIFQKMFDRSSDGSENPELMKKCDDMFKSKITARAAALCADGSYTLYGCGMTNETKTTDPFEPATPKLVYSCYSKCNN